VRRFVLRVRFLILAVAWLLVPSAHADYMDHFVVRQDVGPQKVPSLGKSHWVLIPVEVAGFPAFDLPALQAFYSGTFKDYYRTASLNRFEPTVTVLPPVRYDQCPLSEVDFPGCAVSRGDGRALGVANGLLRDIIQRANAAGADFAQFDINGRSEAPDGYADGVMVLSNTPFSGIAYPVGFFNDGDNLAGGTSGPFIVDGVKIAHVAIGGNADNEVMVHEAGHLLGLTDLYDESGRYMGLPLSFMGSWSYGPRIPLPDAETRYRLRWGYVTQASWTRRYILRPSETSGDILRLGVGDEYFLLENRGPGRYDQNLATRGLAVFHVDRSGLSGAEGSFLDRLLFCVNCNPWRPYIRLVEADLRADIASGGEYSSWTDLFGRGDAISSRSSKAAFGPDNPQQSLRWYDGTVSGFAIKDVFVHGDGRIELTVEAPEADVCAAPLCADGVACVPVNCDEGTSGCGSSRGSANEVPWALLLIFCGTVLRRRSANRPSGHFDVVRRH